MSQLWHRIDRAAAENQTLQLQQIFSNLTANDLNTLVSPSDTQATVLMWLIRLFDQPRNYSHLLLNRLNSPTFDHTNLDVDKLNPKNRNTALIYTATDLGHVGVAKKLLEWGADPFAKNESSLTPFRAACKAGNVDVVELLLPLMPDDEFRLERRGIELNRTPWEWAKARSDRNVYRIHDYRFRDYDQVLALIHNERVARGLVDS